MRLLKKTPGRIIFSGHKAFVLLDARPDHLRPEYKKTAVAGGIQIAL